MSGQVWVPQPTSVPNPGEMSAYLLGKGWGLTTQNERWAEYARTISDETVAVEVPQQSSAGDYARVLGTLLADLARLEARKPSDVLRDVKAASMDIVRLGVEGALTRDGRIPVEGGMRAYEAARGLLLSAACSVLDPRPVHPKRKPQEAMDLLKTARFGQTEVGSFVLTIECSIAPRLQGSLIPGTDHDAPFERQTSLRLAQALQGAENASRESAASGKLDPFRARAHEGVTANLCESLADLIVAAEADRIRASFSFASRRPLAHDVPSTASFSADLAPILREAAKQLRYETPQPDVEIIGPVVKLTSSDLNVGGEVVLQTVIDGKARSVRVRLRADGYQNAVDAHRDGTFLRCSGELARDGGAWVLRDVREIGVVAGVGEE